MKLKKLIPFSWMPASWGLKGKSRAIAEAEYYYTGVDLKLSLNEIETEDNYEYEIKRAEILAEQAGSTDAILALTKLDIDLAHGKITEYIYASKKLDLELEQGLIIKAEHEARQLEIDKQFGKVTDDEYKLTQLTHDLRDKKINADVFERETANIKGEPYVGVLSMDINEEMPTQGSFELDWNDEFIKMLADAGLTGKSDEDVVNKWFNAVCRTVLTQEEADLDYGLNTQDQPNQTKERSDVIRINPRSKSEDSSSETDQ